MAVWTSDQGFVLGAAGLLRDKYKWIPPTDPPPDSAAVPDSKWPVPEPSGLQACTASAIAAAIELTQKQPVGSRIQPSVPFIYYTARYLQLQENEDAGASIYNGLKAGFYFGFCRDSDWRLSAHLTATDKPPAPAETNAKQYGVITFKHISRDDPDADFLTTCKQAINAGYPLIFGVPVDDRFLTGQFAPEFVIQTPPLTGGAAPPHRHCLLAVAYELRPAGTFFWVRDSLGPDRGDAGYLRIPADYFASTRECWLIEQAATSAGPALTAYLAARSRHWELARTFSRQMSDAYKSDKDSAGAHTLATSATSVSPATFDDQAFEQRVAELKFPPDLA